MKSEELAKTTAIRKSSGGAWMSMLCAALLMLLAPSLTSCSEDEGTEDEYADWQSRNDAFFASLEDSLNNGNGQWLKFKTYSKDQNTAGKPTEYIYAKVINAGDTGLASPMFTDSVIVSYEGRLIPSASFPTGYIFESTSYGTYDIKTSAMVKFQTSSLVDGFITALLHMNRNTRWRVYIPYDLAYGGTGQSSIPGYSTLIYDMTLINFSPAGHQMDLMSSRKK